jgi:hypothetical protein
VSAFQVADGYCSPLVKAPECNKQHVMAVGTRSEEDYHTGWCCDLCDKHTLPTVLRWCCRVCDADVCFACHAAPSKDPPWKVISDQRFTSQEELFQRCSDADGTPTSLGDPFERLKPSDVWSDADLRLMSSVDRRHGLSVAHATLPGDCVSLRFHHGVHEMSGVVVDASPDQQTFCVRANRKIYAEVPAANVHLPPCGRQTLDAAASFTGRLIRAEPDNVSKMVELVFEVGGVNISGQAREVFAFDHADPAAIQPFTEAARRKKLLQFATKLKDAVYADCGELLTKLGPPSGGVPTMHAFSFIATGAGSPGQVPHIDLKTGLFQFVAHLTPGPSTLVYTPPVCLPPLSPRAAALHLGIPHEVRGSRGSVEADLALYGNLCHSRGELAHAMQPATPHGAPGGVVGLRHDVIHAGPAATLPRVVMFCVASYTAERYDADFQVTPYHLPNVLESDDPEVVLNVCKAYKEHGPWRYLGFGDATDAIWAVIAQFCNGTLTLAAAAAAMRVTSDAFI